MTKFVNQLHGSFDDKSNEYATVWFDGERVAGFKFHCVMVNSGRGDKPIMHSIHDVSVGARHVWQFTRAHHCVSNVEAVRPDGSTFYVTWVGFPNGDQEFRAGDKWGRPVARFTKQAEYVQGLSSSLVEA